MENLKNIVLLIDADNTRLAKLEDVIREVSARGRITVKRAYGNWRRDKLKNWGAEIKRLGIKAEQQFDHTSNKNATDIALVVDAMQLLHKSIYDAFVIVSSDSDFTPLAIALRESGAYVIGAGETQTPVSFRYSCDEFIFLDNIGRNDKQPEADEQIAAEEAAAPQPKPRQGKSAAAKKQAALKEAELKAAEEKLEAELRSFFGKHFKKQIYKEKKEEIIKAVATSHSKVQVNNNLMKLFGSEEVRIIYHRLEPLIKDMPGQ